MAASGRMTGVLLIDKPAGPTSHDVVARIRRATHERAIGHTGTLDPAATGLLVLVLGRATKLASLLASSTKTYEATIRLGFATSTDDAEGEPLGPPASARPSGADIERVLREFVGTIDQVPPAHSAKKVGGVRAYALARRDKPVELAPVSVRVDQLEVLGTEADTVSIRLTVSSGFYVRALARDVGAALGCGGHLLALRRTACAPFSVADALPLEAAEAAGPALEDALLTPAEALPDLPAVQLTEPGLQRALHGNPLGPAHLVRLPAPDAGRDRPVKILGPDGRLVALAVARSGALHPTLVLG